MKTANLRSDVEMERGWYWCELWLGTESFGAQDVTLAKLPNIITRSQTQDSGKVKASADSSPNVRDFRNLSRQPSEGYAR